MNVLYITSYCDIHDGVSSAIFSQYRMDGPTTDEQLIVYKWKGVIPDEFNAVSSRCVDKILEFAENGAFLIHYYRGIPSNLLNDTIRIVGNTHPVLMTVCQCPFFKPLLLSPYEIKTAWNIVFIDKTSYGCKLLDFIPTEKKSMIYLVSGANIKETELLKQPNNFPYIIFGRGTTLSKCPIDMFDVFDRINIPHKKFIIVGIPEGDNWVRNEAQKRDDVDVYGILPQKDWFQMCSNFDVFLYHLPFSCHASIDGNLGLAMLMRKPVVYMGSEAPKERFEHTKNGYIAENIEEMARYATMLGEDSSLRKKIGENARISTIRNFGNVENRRKTYEDLYKNTTSNPHTRIPLSYYFYYFRYCYKEVIKNLTKVYLHHPGN